MLPFVGRGYPATGFSRSSVDSRPRRFVARTVLSLDNIGTSHQHFTFRLSHNQQNPKPTFDLARRASRLPNYILQCSFFFFARMSCSEQSAFHGQAADPVWFFSELLFPSVKRKKREKKENFANGAARRPLSLRFEPRRAARTPRTAPRRPAPRRTAPAATVSPGGRTQGGY